MSSIDWEIQNTEMPAINRTLLERWIVAVAAEHDRIIGALVYIFCNDERIIEVNREFLQHDYYTDNMLSTIVKIYLQLIYQIQLKQLVKMLFSSVMI